MRQDGVRSAEDGVLRGRGCVTSTVSLPAECRMSSGVAISSLTLPQVLSSCVLLSLSRAWQLGRAVLRARKAHSNVVTAVVEQQQGLLLFTGKVSLSVAM